MRFYYDIYNLIPILTISTFNPPAHNCEVGILIPILQEKDLLRERNKKFVKNYAFKSGEEKSKSSYTRTWESVTLLCSTMDYHLCPTVTEAQEWKKECQNMLGFNEEIHIGKDKNIWK